MNLSLSGEENMRRDRDLLDRVQAGEIPYAIRFYRFSEPTVTYGRLQDPEQVRRVSPAGWPLVQRPTGGGIVMHDKDLCLSIAWRPGQTSIPTRPTEQYQWIHSVILDALAPIIRLNRMSCRQVAESSTSFHKRQCFQEPVACDLLINGQKVVGGALAHRRDGILYQGSIQTLEHLSIEERLAQAMDTCIRQ